MVFKGRFFSSKKSDSSSNSPDGSTNSPRSLGSNSPSRSDKKKSKSASKDEPKAAASTSSGGGGVGWSRQTQVKDAVKKKDAKGKDSQPKTPIKSSLAGLSSPAAATTPKKSAIVEPASVSPILASSLGLNRIKTRSGPLPQESFFGFRGDKGSALGSSNLSRPVAGDGSSGLKKKEAASRTGFNESVTSGSWVDNGSNSDTMSTSSVPSRDQSPNVPAAPSRLQNAGESSAEAGTCSSNAHCFL